MKRHILIVEPDRMIAAPYAEALQAHGYEVSVAAGAQQAIAQADGTLPTLVVLEIQMARHNGVEFLYEFKSYTEWQDVPVVILTSLPSRELARYKSLQEQLQVAAVLRKSETTTELLVQKIDLILGASAA